MGVDSFWYKAVLVVHILAAIVGLGGVILNGLYAVHARDRGGEGALAIRQANFRVTLVAEKAIYLIFVLGIVLVLLSDGSWSFGDTWIWLSMVLFVAALGVSHGVLIPADRATIRELRQASEGGRAPDTVRLDALGRRQAATGPILHVLLVVLLVLMVWKPGS